MKWINQRNLFHFEFPLYIDQPSEQCYSRQKHTAWNNAVTSLIISSGNVRNTGNTPMVGNAPNRLGCSCTRCLFLTSCNVLSSWYLVVYWPFNYCRARGTVIRRCKRRQNYFSLVITFWIYFEINFSSFDSFEFIIFLLAVDFLKHSTLWFLNCIKLHYDQVWWYQ